MASFVALFGLATLGVAQFVPFDWQRPMNAFATLCIVASFALSGHAATAAPRWIAIPTLLLHVVVVAFWLGSLIPLLSALHKERGRRRAIFRRFSEIAVLAVPQLVVAGVVLAVLQIQRFDALFGSVYSLTFTVKLLLVSLLFTLAMINRWILTPEMAEDVPGHVHRFRVTIYGELGLGFAVLCVTAFLSQTVPPRSLTAQQDAVIEATRTAGQTMLIPAGDRKALLMVTPARAGRNTIRARIFAADDGIIDPLEVAVELSNPRAGIEPLRRVLASVGDGFFEYAGPDLAIAGRWVVRIEALIGDFEKSFFETEISVE